MTQYIDASDVAKIVRWELKKAFPDVKFSVKTHRYSGGSSIRVYWVDGPTEKQVEAVAGKYHGAEFDGMNDLQTYNDTGYGNSYIFFERSYSPLFLEKCARVVAEKYGFKKPVVEISPYSGYGYFGNATDWVANSRNEYHWGNTAVARRYASETEA